MIGLVVVVSDLPKLEMLHAYFALSIIEASSFRGNDRHLLTYGT